MGEADTETRRPLKGECGKSVSKSIMAKQCKVCEEKNVPNTRKANNRELYLRNKDNIYNKRLEQRLYDCLVQIYNIRYYCY
ncbi:hypothetical protein GN958_ATG20587 [Phytophthora infestans]|uniref:Uncharacterized protein n=1 Tax=Phytophthora infestans TaxID=4787 RepID=A0A8S9TRQ9_PHYIN|nr:hypothetical protein GN958_ATG20587 [Phytophthora infestans]